MASVKEDFIQRIRDQYYWHIHYVNRGRNNPRWRDRRVVKFPQDLILYAETIFANKPDWIIETGTYCGGSALFFGDMLSLISAPGKVITIDTAPREKVVHPYVDQIIGSSTDSNIIEGIKKKVGNSKVMVVLDSSHKAHHVKRELFYYGKIVTPGQYMVVEDCFTKTSKPYTPYEAVVWYLKGRGKRFRLEHPEERFILAVTREGWIKRI
jgi:cephalosporin hydroxylase